MRIGLREAGAPPGEVLLLDEARDLAAVDRLAVPACASGLALLGVGDVAGVGDELRELTARHGILPDPEVLRDRDLVRGLLVLLVDGVTGRGAHREGAVRDLARLERAAAEIEDEVLRSNTGAGVGHGVGGSEPIERHERGGPDEEDRRAHAARKAQARRCGPHAHVVMVLHGQRVHGDP